MVCSFSAAHLFWDVARARLRSISVSISFRECSDFSKIIFPFWDWSKLLMATRKGTIYSYVGESTNLWLKLGLSFYLQHFVNQIFLSFAHNWSAGLPNVPHVSKMHGQEMYLFQSMSRYFFLFFFAVSAAPPPGPLWRSADLVLQVGWMPISISKCLSLIQL